MYGGVSGLGSVIIESKTRSGRAKVIAKLNSTNSSHFVSNYLRVCLARLDGRWRVDGRVERRNIFQWVNIPRSLQGFIPCFLVINCHGWGCSRQKWIGGISYASRWWINPASIVACVCVCARVRREDPLPTLFYKLQILLLFKLHVTNSNIYIYFFPRFSLPSKDRSQVHMTDPQTALPTGRRELSFRNNKTIV